jgi:hypothetical protein
VVDEKRLPDEPEEVEDDEPEEPVPPVGATEPLGVIELLREEIGGRFGRFFRRR